MRTRSLSAIAVAGALVLAACGDDSADSPAADTPAEAGSDEMSEESGEAMPGTIWRPQPSS